MDHFKSFKIGLITGTVVLLLIVQVSIAEDSAPLSLAQCMSLAMEKSSDLKIQTERLLQARQQYDQARGDMLPDISYRFSRFDQDTADGTVKGHGSTSKITLSQPLFYGFKKEKTLALSKALIREQEQQYKTVVRSLKATVTQAFYLLSQINVDAADVQGTYKLMQERFNELKNRVRLGKSRESEVLMVRSQMAVLRAQEENTAGSRQNTLETLSYLTGVRVDDLKIIDDTPVISTVDPVDTYLAAAVKRSDLESLRQETITQEYRVRIAKGEYWPTLDFAATYYTSRSGSLNNVDWDTLLTLDFPLFQGGITKARVAEETSRLQEIRERLVQLNDVVNTEIRKLHKSLLSSITQAQLFKDAYDQVEKSYQMQLKDYRFGLVNNLEVTQAMTTALDVKRQYDRAQAQVKINKALLDLAIMP